MLTIATMTIMPRRQPPDDPRLIKLGKWVTEQAVTKHLAWKDVPKAYRESGGTWPSSGDVQASKLRVFWRFGNKFGNDALNWLAKWKPHRKPGHSQYETQVSEMRACLQRGHI